MGRIDLETQWCYTGPVFTSRSNTRSLPGHLVGDASLRWRIGSAGTLESRLLNLTDREYQDMLDYTAPGRQWRIGLTWKRAAPTAADRTNGSRRS